MTKEPEKDLGPAQRIALMMPLALMNRITGYRWEQRLPSNAEAIRRLIEAGLAAAGTPAKKGRAK